jgi:hypothetical protein
MAQCGGQLIFVQHVRPNSFRKVAYDAGFGVRGHFLRRRVEPVIFRYIVFTWERSLRRVRILHLLRRQSIIVGRLRVLRCDRWEVL